MQKKQTLEDAARKGLHGSDWHAVGDRPTLSEEGKMRVAKITTAEGAEYFVGLHEVPTSFASMRTILERRGDKVEEVEMAEDEYRQVPATQGAAKFFEGLK